MLFEALRDRGWAFEGATLYAPERTMWLDRTQILWPDREAALGVMEPRLRKLHEDASLWNQDGRTVGEFERTSSDLQSLVDTLIELSGVETFRLVAFTRESINATVAWIQAQDVFEKVVPGRRTNTFEMRDGSHLIEAAVGQSNKVCRVSLRFTLCHPISVDDAFVLLAQRLGADLDATISIVDPVPRDAPMSFAPDELASHFPRILRGAIQQKRALWRADFGNSEAAVTTVEALRRFVFRHGR